jgi:hypothetical protein
METEIWKYDIGRYKVVVVDRELKNKLMSWKECTLHCRYSYMRGEIGWDFIFPGRIYNRVARLVGLPPKRKNPKRVAQGKRLGELAAANDHLHIQASGCVLDAPAINNGGKVCRTM